MKINSNPMPGELFRPIIITIQIDSASEARALEMLCRHANKYCTIPGGDHEIERAFFDQLSPHVTPA